MSRNMLALGTTLIAVVLASATQAVWSDNFDGYGPGSINGQGGWQGWDNVAVNAGVVTPQIFASPPHSQEIGGLADSVHQFSGYNSGVCVFRTLMYIPTDFSGKQFFILLNTYKDLGPYDWSLQIKFDSATGLVTDDFNAGPSLPYITGNWIPLVNVIDLNNDVRTTYYGGNLLSSGSWKRDTGVLNIAAIDLYANYGETSASPVYYDEMYLTPEPGTIATLVCGLSGLLLLRRRR